MMASQHRDATRFVFLISDLVCVNIMVSIVLAHMCLRKLVYQYIIHDTCLILCDEQSRIAFTQQCDRPCS